MSQRSEAVGDAFWPRMATAPTPPGVLATVALTLAATVLTLVATLLVARGSAGAMPAVAFWPQAGVIAGLLIATAGHARVAVSAGAMTGLLAGCHLAGMSSSALALTAATGLEACAVAALIRHDEISASPQSRLRGALLWIAASVAAAAVSAGVLTALDIRADGGAGGALMLWWVWLQAHFLGLIGVAPAMALLARTLLERRTRAGSPIEAVALLALPAVAVAVAQLGSAPSTWALQASLLAVAMATLALCGGLQRAQVSQDEQDELRRRLKVLEAEARGARMRSRELLDATPSILWTAGADGRITWVSERWSDYTGIPPGTIRETWRDFVHPDDLPRVESAWRDGLAQREPFQFERRTRLADGTYRWFLTQASPQRDPSGALIGWIGSSTDIDDLKRAEAALRESEARYRAALQAGRMGSWETDLVAGVRTWSPEGMALFGLDLPDGHDVLGGAGDHWLGALHPDDRHRAPIYYRLAREQDSFVAEYRVVRSDGTTLWLSGRGRVAERLPDGTPRRLVSIMADVSEREAALAELRASEDRFRSMATAAHEGIWTIDREGRTTFANARMAELLRVPIERLEHGRVMDYCEPGDLDAMERRIADCFAGAADQFECKFRRADGTRLYVLAAITPLRDHEGRIASALGSFLDHTERRRAEAAQREAQARLRHAADAAGLTHIVVDYASGSLRAAENHRTVLGFAIAETEQPVALDAAVRGFLTHVPLEDRPKLLQALGREGEVGRGQKFEYRLRAEDGRERWIECISTLESSPGNGPARIFSTHLDVTQRRAAEAHVKLLMHEVNHRAKNLLTVVISIARQTARTASPDVFAYTLAERIHALSASQDLIIEGQWHGVSVADLVVSQLRHLSPEMRARISSHGDAATLTPAAAQGLGMALHELATNALKYGALAAPAGRIEVSWRLTGVGTARRFEITWKESGGPPVSAPTRQGFGRTVIEKMAALAVGGAVDLDYAREGVRWHLEAPAASVCAEGG